MRNVSFVNGGFYHVFNRGVDKRRIFEDETDYQRFYRSMFLFNDKNFQNTGGDSSLSDEKLNVLLEKGDNRESFVKILSFCLLPNHFHLLIQQCVDGGITKFLHRVGMGYARYFNKRYERTGRLFESEYKAVIVARDAQLLHLPRYIHLNALDLTSFAWRDGRIQDWDGAGRFLDQYPWSSHGVYLKGEQHLPVVDTSSVRSLQPSSSEYWSFLKAWAGRENELVSQ